MRTFNCFAIGYALTLLTITWTAGCTRQERLDLYDDVLNKVPAATNQIFAERGEDGGISYRVPNSEDAIAVGATHLLALLSGWFGRRFVEKKYAKKQNV